MGYDATPDTPLHHGSNINMSVDLNDVDDAENVFKNIQLYTHIIINLNIIITLIFSYLLFKEKINKSCFIGILIALIGILIIVFNYKGCCKLFYQQLFAFQWDNEDNNPLFQ